MRFKVGDKVRVRKDLVIDKRYGSQFFGKSMKRFKGKEFIVEEAFGCDGTYFLNEAEKWFWTDEMLEPVEKKK